MLFGCGMWVLDMATELFPANPSYHYHHHHQPASSLCVHNCLSLFHHQLTHMWSTWRATTTVSKCSPKKTATGKGFYCLWDVCGSSYSGPKDYLWAWFIEHNMVGLVCMRSKETDTLCPYIRWLILRNKNHVFAAVVATEPFNGYKNSVGP